MLKVEAVIRAAQHEARLAAIAECARVCKERGDHLHRERRYDESEEAHSLADMIRALATGEGGG
jgi:hypothetical protein